MAEKRRWTPIEDDLLHFWWGVFHIERVAARLKRSVPAVAQRAHRLKLGSPGRGTMTLREFSEHTGFARDSILLAAQRIGVTIPRRARGKCSQRGTQGRFYSIDADLAEKLLAHLDPVLGNRKWSSNWGEKGRIKVLPGACVACGTTERPHYAKDLCRRCYLNMKRAGKRYRNPSTRSNRNDPAGL
jgi:hypothetical protein